MATREVHQFVPDLADVPDPADMAIERPGGALGTRRHAAKISRSKRGRVYERDGHRCVECGATEDLTLDHILPRVLGGTNDEANLRTLCRSCNSRKGARV